MEDSGWVLHGIYVGGGQVVAPVFNGWTFSPVAQVAIASFFEDGMQMRVRRYARPVHAGAAAVARIMSRIGEEIEMDLGAMCTWAVTGAQHCAPGDYVDLPCEIADPTPGAAPCRR